MRTIRLGVNIDHIATLRQARGGAEPDPVNAAGICERAGADGITIHLREDRRHIQDRDLELLRQVVSTHLNLEMGNSPEIVEIALRVKPDQVTLVPERRLELTTEGGLDVAGQEKEIAKTVARFRKAGIRVSLFIDPDEEQVKASSTVGAECVEFHTGRYANATGRERDEELERLQDACVFAHKKGLLVFAGHGLDYHNTPAVCALPYVEELNIGHSIISRSVFSGLEMAVSDMKELLVLNSGND